MELIDKGSLVGMCVASFLIWNANFMGKKFEEYTESGYIVGETNDDDDDVDTGGYTEVNGGGKSNVEMASRQNDESETSCAFYDDDSIGEEEEGQSLSGAEDDKHIVATV